MSGGGGWLRPRSSYGPITTSAPVAASARNENKTTIGTKIREGMGVTPFLTELEGPGRVRASCLGDEGNQ